MAAPEIDSVDGIKIGNVLIHDGNVDGRDVSADGTTLDGLSAGAYPGAGEQAFLDADHDKLDGIEDGATTDQSNAEIRAAVEAATDSNVFTDADHTKLDGITPSGIIVMWHGLIVNIPSGWLKCDGTNSTPDLRASFVRGAPGTTEAGSTGGADTHTLTTNEIPSHTHSVEGDTTEGNSSSCFDRGVSPEGISLVSTSSTGGGVAHNNMPTYYEVIYIMKS